ncbi:MAG TPA: hypothetical protein VL588_10735 [Bdellovibrionota bacterium]|jgi:hypothetical protein|nr:hypothetical protein [Bdellovibrionota bacterium]
MVELRRILALAVCAFFFGACGGGGGGSDISGGGNGVVCVEHPSTLDPYRDSSGRVPPDRVEDFLSHHLDEVKSVEMVDLLEARLPRGWQSAGPEPLISPSGDETVDAFLGRIIDRLSYQVPPLARTVRWGQEQLAKGAIKKSTRAMPQIRDHNPLGSIDHEHCFTATLASQRLTSHGLEITVDSRLYDHPSHSLQSRAVLLLHEFLYAAARDHGQHTSRRTRALIGLILSDNKDRKIGDLMRLAQRLDLSFEPVMKTYVREIMEPIVRDLLQTARSAYGLVSGATPEVRRRTIERAMTERSNAEYPPRLAVYAGFSPQAQRAVIDELLISKLIPAISTACVGVEPFSLPDVLRDGGESHCVPERPIDREDIESLVQKIGADYDHEYAGLPMDVRFPIVPQLDGSSDSEPVEDVLPVEDVPPAQDASSDQDEWSDQCVGFDANHHCIHAPSHHLEAIHGSKGRAAADKGGSDISGGGNGVVCFNDPSVARSILASGVRVLPSSAIASIRSVETLDLWEARRNGEEIDPRFDSQDLRHGLRVLMAKISWVSPRLMEDIEREIELLHPEDIIREPYGLEPVDDMGPVQPLADPSCVKITLAAHFHAHEETIVHLDARLFDHAANSSVSRAVLAFHEILYSIARRHGARNSADIRAVVSQLLRKESRAGLPALLNRAGLGPFEGYSREITGMLQRDLFHFYIWMRIGVSAGFSGGSNPEQRLIRDMTQDYCTQYSKTWMAPFWVAGDQSPMDRYFREEIIPALANRFNAMYWEHRAAQDHGQPYDLQASLDAARRDFEPRFQRLASIGPAVWTPPTGKSEDLVHVVGEACQGMGSLDFTLNH